LRPFLKADPARTFAVLLRWTEDPSHHVRRAASEGSRPRLPWGERVPCLTEDPSRGLAVLEALRFDAELYVRKSVANHLNDFASSHPKLVLQTLRRWRAEAPAGRAADVEWIIRRALRGPIKRGDREALALIGAGRAAAVVARALKLAKSRVRVGEALEFAVTLDSTASSPQKLVVDYLIDFVNASGRHSRKVFKLRTFELAAGAHATLSKRHSLKPITTRVYYPGEHRLAIQVNGAVLAEKAWRLQT
jgi:3-methyladenine DNA glycosylase AlkC